MMMFLDCINTRSNMITFTRKLKTWIVLDLVHSFKNTVFLIQSFSDAYANSIETMSDKLCSSLLLEIQKRNDFI